MTRKLTPALLVTAVVLSLAAFAQTTRAAAGPAPTAPTTTAGSPTAVKVGFISFEQAVFSTNEGQRELEALQKKFDPKTQELKSQKDEIDALQKQLQTQSDKLNEEARANLVKQIEAKNKNFQRNGEDAQAEYGRELNEISNRVGQKVFKTLTKYAEANGYAAIINVLPSDQQNPPGQLSLLWFVPQVNVTKEIIDLYNKESGVAPPASTSKPTAPRPAAPKAPASTTTTPKK